MCPARIATFSGYVSSSTLIDDDRQLNDEEQLMQFHLLERRGEFNLWTKQLYRTLVLRLSVTLLAILMLGAVFDSKLIVDLLISAVNTLIYCLFVIKCVKYVKIDLFEGNNFEKFQLLWMISICALILHLCYFSIQIHYFFMLACVISLVWNAFSFNFYIQIIEGNHGGGQFVNNAQAEIALSSALYCIVIVSYCFNVILTMMFYYGPELSQHYESFSIDNFLVNIISTQINN